MIQMEYDVRTAGVRVSFIVVDGEHALEVGAGKQFAGGMRKDGKWTAPQSLENTRVLIAMLEAMCSRKEKQLDSP